MTAPAPGMGPPVVVRRALGGPRDLARVEPLLRELAVPLGPRFGAALGRDDWGLVLIAEQRGAVVGLVLLRWFAALGAAEGDPAATGWVERLWVAPSQAGQGVAEALGDAARAEAEARGVGQVVGLDAGPPAEPPEARRTEPQPPAPPAEDTLLPEKQGADRSGAKTPGWVVRDRQVLGRYRLVAGVELVREVEADGPAVTTLWSGAQALRTRWRGDRLGAAWSREDCLGSLDRGGDVLRFDPDTLRVRESYLVRPTSARVDPVLWEAARGAPVLGGTLSLDPAAVGVDFEMPPTAELLFDPGLRCLAALTEGYLRQRTVSDEGQDLVPPLEAVALSPILALLFSDGAYVGWRALDPVDAARPMGWPEVRDRGPIDPEHRGSLVSLLHAWMTVDAQGPVRPDEADDPSALDPMVAVRDQARSLAGLDLDPLDPLPGVARDVAADVHWRWGFFRLGE